MVNSVLGELSRNDDPFPDIPDRFSKLVTFKSSNRYNNETGRKGKYHKGSGKTSLIFEEIKEFR